MNQQVNSCLDPRVGDLSLFRAADETVMDKLKNEFAERGVNIKSLGAKGDGKTNDINVILDALNKYDVIWFPSGEYAIHETLSIINMKNKTLNFSSNAKIVKTGGSRAPVVRVENSSNINISNITIDSKKPSKDENNSSSIANNAILCRSSSYLNFYGVTTIKYTDSISFVLRAGTHKVFIDTLVIDDPDTRDGLSLMNCWDVTVNTVIGRDNDDDLVVLKSVGGPTYNIQIGKIHSYNAYGAFSIGGEVWDGDIYNVTVGQITCHNTRRGIYFKMGKNDQKDEPISSQRGEVYNIHIGSFLSYVDEANKALAHIMVNITEDEVVPNAFLHKYHDITIDYACLRGGYYGHAVYLHSVKRFNINHLEVHTLTIDGELRTNMNATGVFMEKCEDCYIGGGYIEAIQRPLHVYDFSNNNRFENLKLKSISEDSPLVRIRLATGNLISQCDLSAPHDTSIGSVQLINGEVQRDGKTISINTRATTILKNNKGRNDKRTAPPTNGTFYVGETIENASPAIGSYVGWICTSYGSPGTWRGYGRIE